VDVLDAPGQVGRGAVVLAVDDVADPADCEADESARPSGIDDLPERLSVAPAPQVGADDGAEEAAPLADPALIQVQDAHPLADELLVVLPDEKEAGADQAHYDHPDGCVGDSGRFDAVVAPGEPLAQAPRGQDAEHAE